MIYKIANLNIKINTLFGSTERFLKDYISDSFDFDVEVTVNYADIKAERKNCDGDFCDEYLETIALCRKLANLLPDFNGFLLHSSVVSVNGTGVCFAARSGVGKTTHTLFWKQLLGERLKIVNGDKPIVRIEKGLPIAFGTPWCGKENLSVNMFVPIRHICFIVRDKKNFVTVLDKKDAVNRILNQIYMPESAHSVVKTLALTDAFLKRSEIWEIHCLPDLNSAEVAYKTIIEGEKNET